MSLAELQKYTFTAKYARWNKDLNRRETWNEAVNRVKSMMLEKYKDKTEVHKDIEFAYDMMKKKRVLGSQRALQFGGDPIFRHEMKIYNCISSYCDRARFFAECMYLLLCGCGTGFSVQFQHVNKLPPVKQLGEQSLFVVEDSIEGWADCIGVLIESYIGGPDFPTYHGKNIEFDFSQIRPEGAPVGVYGKAPGPEPLKKAVEKIRAILNGAIGRKLKPIECYDIVMHSSDAVLSGGIRRAATIALFSHNDNEMMAAKTGNWFYENPQRGRSNNSVVLVKNETSLEQFQEIIFKIKEFGEPGFLLVDNDEMLVNPCCISGKANLSLPNFGSKPIKDAKIGDVILSKDGPCKITDKWSNGLKDVYKYIFQFNSIPDDFGSEINEYYIVATPDHKIDCLGNLTEIDNAQFCDVVLFEENIGRFLHTNVKFIRKEKLPQEEVFDITVDSPSHTFFANGISVSNCEIGLYGYNETGESGWEPCNLSTINAAKVKTEQDFYDSCKAAAIIGTLQAGFTNQGYLTNVSRQIMEREALLGVSMTGIMESPDICLDPEIQRKGAEIVKTVNKEIAAKIGINPAARTTTVKPEGSSSCVLGTSSGIHPHHAKRYIRRVQANRLESVYQHFKNVNPKACERSVWSNNNTDDVIAFCVEVPDGAKLKNKVSAIKLLEAVKLTQENWINGGKDIDLCVKPWLTHNVSNTINVKADEWDGVTKYIYDNKEYFCGISILPVTGDKDYPQAPFTSIYTPPEMIKFYGDGVMFVSGLIDKALELWEDNLWTACDALNLRRDINGSAKKNWVGRCEKFAIKYFDGDIRRLTYAMKDVYNYKLWTELQISYQPVDYETLTETKDNTNLSQELACSGGKCELI